MKAPVQSSISPTPPATTRKATRRTTAPRSRRWPRNSRASAGTRTNRPGNSAAARSAQRDREPAQVGVDHQPGLPAAQLQYRALLVGQDDRPDAAADRGPGAARAIDAGDIGRPVDIADHPRQISLRGAEHEAKVQPADRQRIAPAVERQRAAAAGG